MGAAATYLHTPILAWSVSAEDEERFKRILRQVLVVCLLAALVMPWLPVREPDRAAPEPLPPRLAKLLLDREAPPPAPLPKLDRPVPKDEAKTVAPNVPKAEPKTSVVEARRPEANKPPVKSSRTRAPRVRRGPARDEKRTRRTARGPGRRTAKQRHQAGPGRGFGVGPGVGAGVGPGVPTRSLITSNATGGSGGINTAAYSRDTGGGGLAGRSTTLVEGVAGGAGGGGPGGVAHGSAGRPGRVAAAQVARCSGARAARRRVRSRRSSSCSRRTRRDLFHVYRALRDEPSLQGKVVLELKISPAGQVVDLRIVSSELKAPDLERKLLARIKLFDFGAKDVDAITVTWPVDFLPS